jgi:ABC-type nitrate/sulfonate/bicarbonate transport system substrate-binding protein
VAVTLCFSNVLPAASEEPLVLRLKWFHQFQFAGYYAALEKGFFKQEGLNVVIKQRDVSKNPLDEVVNGEVDFGISDSSLILKRLNGSPVVALAVIMQSSPLVLMSLAEKEVTTPLDLIGKRLMYQENVDDAIIMGVLNEFNIQKKDFQFVPHNFDDQALINDQTDVISAYITDQPYTYRQKGLAINIINPANYGVDFYGDNLFTSEKMLNQNPDQVMAFRRASLKGWKYALNNTDEIVDLIIDKYGSKKSRDALLYEANMTKRMIKPKLIEIGNINPSRFKRISEIYKEKGLVQIDANLNGFHYLDYMQKSNNLIALVIVVSSILVISIVVLLFVILINSRLKKAVQTRTENLAEANLRLKKLIGFVAHDLRNPLGAILSFSKMAQSPRYKERLPQVLQNIGASAAKGLELVKSALETTALGTGKFELELTTFALKDAIESSVESFKTIANGKDVRFDVAVPTDTLVKGDVNRIIQVLDNIILNAIKYSSESSVIEIQSEVRARVVTVVCKNSVPQDYQVEAEEEGLYRSFGFGIEIIREILEQHHSHLELNTVNEEFVVKFTLKLD